MLHDLIFPAAAALIWAFCAARAIIRAPGDLNWVAVTAAVIGGPIVLAVQEYTFRRAARR